MPPKRTKKATNVASTSTTRSSGSPSGKTKVAVTARRTTVTRKTASSSPSRASTRAESTKTASDVAEPRSRSKKPATDVEEAHVSKKNTVLKSSKTTTASKKKTSKSGRVAVVTTRNASLRPALNTHHDAAAHHHEHHVSFIEAQLKDHVDTNTATSDTILPSKKILVHVENADVGTSPEAQSAVKTKSKRKSTATTSKSKDEEQPLVVKKSKKVDVKKEQSPLVTKKTKKPPTKKATTTKTTSKKSNSLKSSSRSAVTAEPKETTEEDVEPESVSVSSKSVHAARPIIDARFNPFLVLSAKAIHGLSKTPKHFASETEAREQLSTGSTRKTGKKASSRKSNVSLNVNDNKSPITVFDLVAWIRGSEKGELASLSDIISIGTTSTKKKSGKLTKSASSNAILKSAQETQKATGNNDRIDPELNVNTHRIFAEAMETLAAHNILVKVRPEITSQVSKSEGPDGYVFSDFVLSKLRTKSGAALKKSALKELEEIIRSAVSTQEKTFELEAKVVASKKRLREEDKADSDIESDGYESDKESGISTSPERISRFPISPKGSPSPASRSKHYRNTTLWQDASPLKSPGKKEEKSTSPPRKQARVQVVLDRRDSTPDTPRRKVSFTPMVPTKDGSFVRTEDLGNDVKPGFFAYIRSFFRSIK